MSATGALLAGVALAEPVPIGAVSAANQDVRGTPPGLAQRRLDIGFDINAEERIETADIGAGQFVFLDQTTLNVWPNSNIVLDRFVYDPRQGEGDISMTMTRGFLRFIGGRITKQEDAKIATPAGVVFIRGGIAHVETTGDVTVAVHIAGEYTRLNGVNLSRANAAAEARRGADGTVTTRFLGVLTPEQVAAIFGRAPGRGSGGLIEPPDDEIAGRAIEATEADRLGMRNREAPAQNRVSTMGEQERSADQETVVAFVTPRTEDRQIALADIAGAAPADGGPDPLDGDDPDFEGPDDGGPDDGGPDDGGPDDGGPDDGGPDDGGPDDGGPDDGGPDDGGGPSTGTSATPLLGLGGSLVAVSGSPGDFALDGVGTPLSAFAALSSDGGVAVVGQAAGGAAGAEDVSAPAARTGQFVRLPATTDGRQVVLQGVLDDLPARVDVLVAPGVFHFGAFATLADTPTFAVGFFGEPTPASYWVEAGPQRVLTYETGPALFTGAGSPLPAALAGAFDASPRILLVSGSDGAFVGAPGQDAGGAAPAASIAAFGGFAGALTTFDAPPAAAGPGRALGAFVSIQGRGAQQRSVFGAAAGAVGVTSTGAPGWGAVMALGARFEADGDIGFGRSVLGSLATPEGDTAYGPAGDFVLLGSAARFGVDGFATAPVANLFSGAPGEPGASFGEARIARLTGVDVVGPSRGGVGVHPSVSRYAATADPRITSVLTGGFAAAAGQFSSPATGGAGRSYLAATPSASDVAVGFAPQVNGVAIEILDLDAVTGEDRVHLEALPYGDLAGRDGLVDDGRFAALASERGLLTGRSREADARAHLEEGRPPSGAVASSGLSGDGGLFPQGTRATPEHLRWGWWNGEVAFASTSPDPAFAGRTDRLHLGVWVGGVLSRSADVRAQTGTATYDGFAAAHVIESTAAGEASYVEGGRFGMSYDFKSRTGSATIDGVLGQSVTFELSRREVSGANQYAGRATGGFTNGPGSGQLRGAFFTANASPIAATAGSFQIEGVAGSGNPASAVGVFGADRLE